jgi:hypothetical protein
MPGQKQSVKTRSRLMAPRWPPASPPTPPTPSPRLLDGFACGVQRAEPERRQALSGLQLIGLLDRRRRRGGQEGVEVVPAARAERQHSETVAGAARRPGRYPETTQQRKGVGQWIINPTQPAPARQSRADPDARIRRTGGGQALTETVAYHFHQMTRPVHISIELLTSISTTPGWPGIRARPPALLTSRPGRSLRARRFFSLTRLPGATLTPGPNLFALNFS